MTSLPYDINNDVMANNDISYNYLQHTDNSNNVISNNNVIINDISLNNVSNNDVFIPYIGNYNIEGNINFYSELLKNDDTDIDNTDKCLLSLEPLNDTCITLLCGHKFNYMPLYREIYQKKIIINILDIKLLKHQIKCPYCRTIINNILPATIDIHGVHRMIGINKPEILQMKIQCKDSKQCHQHTYITPYGAYCKIHYTKYKKSLKTIKTIKTIKKTESIKNNSESNPVVFIDSIEKYTKYTINTLKTMLRASGLPVSGNKMILINRLIDNNTNNTNNTNNNNNNNITNQ
jgi:hypothetical protein